jgi:hypothetical protein
MSNVRVQAVLREVIPDRFYRHILYAGLGCLVAIVALGSLERLFGGNAEWRSAGGGHFFLGRKIGPQVEVSAFAYWLSVCVLWLARLAFAWLAVVCLIYAVRKYARS